jgi:hypothetical protein
MPERSRKHQPRHRPGFQVMRLADLMAFPKPGHAKFPAENDEEKELTRDLLYALAMTWPDGEVTVRVNNETSKITEVVAPKRPKPPEMPRPS